MFPPGAARPMGEHANHPNGEGRWTRLENTDDVTLWKREHPSIPVTQFYVVAPSRQHEIVYGEAKARDRFEILAAEQGPKR